MIMTSIDIKNIKLTIFILFNPEAQNTINSLSFSNLSIVNIMATRKQKGISLVTIFGRLNNEYEK